MATLVPNQLQLDEQEVLARLYRLTGLEFDSVPQSLILEKAGSPMTLPAFSLSSSLVENHDANRLRNNRIHYV